MQNKPRLNHRVAVCAAGLLVAASAWPKGGLDAPTLRQYGGRYAYRSGFNPAAIIALIIGILPNVLGFLTAIGVLDKGAVWPGLVAVYNYAWFVGFGVSGAVYWVLMRGQVNEPAPAVAEATTAATFAP